MPEHYTSPVKAPDPEHKKVLLVKRTHEGLSYQLDGKIEDVIQRLILLKESTPDDCTLHLNFEKVYGTWGDEDTWEVALYDRRLETDEECRIRLQKAEQDKLDKRATQMAQLAHLKKELGED